MQVYGRSQYPPLAAKSETFATDILWHPLYVGVDEAILGPSCAAMQLQKMLIEAEAQSESSTHRLRMFNSELLWNLA